MANGYIRKYDAIYALDKEYRYGAEIDRCGLAKAFKAIESLEPADVAPVVHAYWIPQKENHEFKEAWMKCSACGYPVSRWTGNTNFCPNCGAKMDGEE